MEELFSEMLEQPSENNTARGSTWDLEFAVSSRSCAMFKLNDFV